MDIKKQLAAVAAYLNIPKIKGKELPFNQWFPVATQGKSQKEVLNLLDMYQAKRDMEHSLGETLVELKKQKMVKKPEHLIIKAYGFLEVKDAATEPCGVYEYDKKYKNFFAGLKIKLEKPRSGEYRKVFPPIIAEAKIFDSRAHLYSYLRLMLKKGIRRERIRRFMKQFYIGRAAFRKKYDQLVERFCAADNPAIRGLLVYPARTYRMPKYTAVAGEGQYAKIVRY